MNRDLCIFVEMAFWMTILWEIESKNIIICIYVFHITQVFSSVSINILHHLAVEIFKLHTHTHIFKDNLMFWLIQGFFFLSEEENFWTVLFQGFLVCLFDFNLEGLNLKLLSKKKFRVFKQVLLETQNTSPILLFYYL